ncbi:MAG: NAD(P)H-dependent oxidoreductase [Flavobacteriaceae bacterium]|nr:NAD(P)H-dependent oxidoreductase [Flavobacteriaceae bacterium]
MKKIIAFGASNSKKSINKAFARFAAQQFNTTNIEIIDLNDFEMPLFSVDKEKETGIPSLAQDFFNKISECDLLVISLAEHNGNFTVAFKNILDWVSRINTKVFQDIPMLLLATSPGARGGSSVLEIAKNRFPYQGGKIIASFSLPNFNENFDLDKGITNSEYRNKLLKIVNSVQF